MGISYYNNCWVKSSDYQENVTLCEEDEVLNYTRSNFKIKIITPFFIADLEIEKKIIFGSFFSL